MGCAVNCIRVFYGIFRTSGFVYGERQTEEKMIGLVWRCRESDGETPDRSDRCAEGNAFGAALSQIQRIISNESYRRDV
jgi:hypothetical protein